MISPRIAIIALALTLAAPSPAAEAADLTEVRQIVRQALDEVLAVLAQRALSEAERLARVEAIAYGHFDFSAMSRLVMGRNWKRLSQDQQATFMTEFKVLLSRNYGRRLDRYGDEKVDIVGARSEPRGDATVLTKIVGGQFDNFEINYRMRPREGTWKGIDVVIEGVSLVSSYRDQFKDIMGRGGPERLLERMREKNAEPLGDQDD